MLSVAVVVVAFTSLAAALDALAVTLTVVLVLIPALFRAAVAAAIAAEVSALVIIFDDRVFSEQREKQILLVILGDLLKHTSKRGWHLTNLIILLWKILKSYKYLFGLA
uniref:Uncharacterized protein n=1 Tax=Glossina austeni TaxID=7395 RepID=A0A1A9UR50_GLOAU